MATFYQSSEEDEEDPFSGLRDNPFCVFQSNFFDICYITIQSGSPATNKLPMG